MQVRNLISEPNNTHARVERAKQLIEEKGSDVAHESRKRYRRARHYAKANPVTIAAGAAVAVGALSALLFWHRK
ncbi:hypothetical protein [Marinimicrobium locisalis]|uniref:hypothetical protein n=1 Tax=Marinimicrobium locisalis TaxID=546022 RepID=UPI003221CB33